MTDPTLAAQTPYGRMYARERGGTPLVPSITTVQGVYDAEMGWWEALSAARCIIEDERNGQYYQMPDSGQRRAKKWQIIQWAKSAAERDRDAAAARGDLIHNYAEFHALRILDRATEAEVDHQRDLALAAGLGPYLRSFHAFWDKFSPTPVAPEATVWNHTVGYAGTTDLICLINGVLVVLDYKTRKAILDRDGIPKPTTLTSKIAMQLTAAARGEEYWVESRDGVSDEWLPWPHKTEIGVGVALGPDTFHVQPYDITHPLSWDTFKSLRQAWEWKRSGSALMGEALSAPSELRVDLFKK